MIRGVVVLAVVAIGCNAKFKQLPQRSPPAQLAPALDAPTSPRRLGFLEGEISVPKDFDRMGDEAIAAMFGLTG